MPQNMSCNSSSKSLCVQRCRALTTLLWDIPGQPFDGREAFQEVLGANSAVPVTLILPCPGVNVWLVQSSSLLWLSRHFPLNPGTVSVGLLSSFYPARYSNEHDRYNSSYDRYHGYRTHPRPHYHSPPPPCSLALRPPPIHLFT